MTTRQTTFHINGDGYIAYVTRSPLQVSEGIQTREYFIADSSERLIFKITHTVYPNKSYNIFAHEIIGNASYCCDVIGILGEYGTLDHAFHAAITLLQSRFDNDKRLCAREHFNRIENFVQKCTGPIQFVAALGSQDYVDFKTSLREVWRHVDGTEDAAGEMLIVTPRNAHRRFAIAVNPYTRVALLVTRDDALRMFSKAGKA